MKPPRFPASPPGRLLDSQGFQGLQLQGCTRVGDCCGAGSWVALRPTPELGLARLPSFLPGAGSPAAPAQEAPEVQTLQSQVAAD